MTVISCQCKATKKYKLIFDGGIMGNYSVFLCSQCHTIQDKKFMIKEEVITEINGQGRPSLISDKESFIDDNT